MKPAIRDRLREELRSRGFKDSGDSPHGTMTLDEDYLDAVALSDLLDMMVSRREKFFRSEQAVGPDIAKKGYDDVVLVIEATKLVVEEYCR